MQEFQERKPPHCLQASAHCCVVHQMNIHTFKDAANSKRNALINDLDEDDGDDDHEVTTRDKRREVDGEEETGAEAVSVQLLNCSYFT